MSKPTDRAARLAALEKQVEAISKYLRVTAKTTDAACDALLIASDRSGCPSHEPMRDTRRPDADPIYCIHCQQRLMRIGGKWVLWQPRHQHTNTPLIEQADK